jgi:hypothetical protein
LRKILQEVRRKDTTRSARRQRIEIEITTKTRYLSTTTTTIIIIIITVTPLDTAILVNTMKIDTSSNALGIPRTMVMIGSTLTRRGIGERVGMMPNHLISLDLSSRRKEQA